MTDRSDWATATPKKRGEIWVRQEGEAAAVYDPDSGRLYALNPSALALWELCDGSTSAREMAEALSELTGQTANMTFEEVTTTLQTLSDQGLVESGGD